MKRTLSQAYDLARAARIRREIEIETRKHGHEAVLRELGSFTTAQFNAARKRPEGIIPVGIPAHNEGGPKSDLPATLLALARTEGAFPVIINNRSTDDTADIARILGAQVIDAPLGRKMAATQAGIKYVRQELRAGHMLFTDADTLVPAQWPISMTTQLTNEAHLAAGAALFGGSIKWHGPSRAADLALSAHGILDAYKKRHQSAPPTAHGHNYGLQFDSGDVLEAAITALPPDVFVEQGIADDALIGDTVVKAGAHVTGPASLGEFVVTRGDRITSLRSAARLLICHESYNQITQQSYAAEYPHFN